MEKGGENKSFPLALSDAEVLAICTFLINNDPSLNTELPFTGKGCGESMGLHEFLILQLYRIGTLLLCTQTPYYESVKL